MRLSPEKVLHLTNVLIRALDVAEDESEAYTVKAEEEDLRHAIRGVITGFLQKEERIAESVKVKIRSIRRGIPEGSAEFDALFRQLYDEEMAKLRKIR